MSEEAWEYLTKIRELPFDDFIRWRLKRDRAYLMKSASDGGKRGRAQPPKHVCTCNLKGTCPVCVANIE